MNEISAPIRSMPTGCPFPTNRYFKGDTSRMLARAEGMSYYTPEGKEILDGTAACGAA